MPDSPEENMLGDLIRDTRIRQGISASRLALLTDRHKSTLLAIERGETTRPKPEVLEQLSDILGLSLGELYRLAGYRVPETPLDVTSFLHVKHRDLHSDDVDRIARIVESEVRRSKEGSTKTE